MGWGIGSGKVYIGVAFGNTLYFLFILLLIALVFGTRSLCRRFGKEFTRNLLLILYWSNFALHFLKQFNPYYISRLPNSLGSSSLENFCAILIVISPFVFVFGNDYLKDYLFYVGIVSGIMVYLVPTGALGRDLGDLDSLLEVLRFYGCHAPLVIGGYLMVEEGLHRLDYHRLWAIPLMFTAVNGVVFLNGVFLGFVLHFPGWPSTWEQFSDRDCFVNQSFTFGPMRQFDGTLGWVYKLMIPGLQTYHNSNGELCFVPVIYMLIPLYIATALFGPWLCYKYEKRHYRMDFEEWKQRLKMRRYKSAKRKGAITR